MKSNTLFNLSFNSSFPLRILAIFSVPLAELRVGYNAQIHQFDITSKESIEKFTIFINKLKQIYILVNNAGYTSCGFVEGIPLLYIFEHKAPLSHNNLCHR